MNDMKLKEAYEKANDFIDRNMEQWIKEYGLTEDQVTAIHACMGACESLGVDITSFEGWELV